MRNRGGASPRRLQSVLERAAQRPGVRRRVEANTAVREVASRHYAGETALDAAAVVVGLHSKGLLTTLAHMGPLHPTPAQADDAVASQWELVEQLTRAGHFAESGLSVAPTSLGIMDDFDAAVGRGRLLCEAARSGGGAVTLDAQQSTTTSAAIRLWQALRETHPETGLTLQARLRRTGDDVERVASDGARLRLVFGAYAEPASEAFLRRRETDLAYVRNLRVLMSSDAYPMIATRDPRIIEIACCLAECGLKQVDGFEFQQLLGVRPLEQRRLADIGYRSRVYVPWGVGWYDYLVGRVSHTPGVLGMYLRSLVVKR